MIGHIKPGQFYNIARAILIILPSLSQSAWNTRFHFGHQKPCMDNNIAYIEKCEREQRLKQSILNHSLAVRVLLT